MRWAPWQSGSGTGSSWSTRLFSWVLSLLIKCKQGLLCTPAGESGALKWWKTRAEKHVSAAIACLPVFYIPSFRFNSIIATATTHKTQPNESFCNGLASDAGAIEHHPHVDGCWWNRCARLTINRYTNTFDNANRTICPTPAPLPFPSLVHLEQNLQLPNQCVRAH